MLSLSNGVAIPVRVSVTFCGEPVALSVTSRCVPESAAAEAGLNATYIEQDALIAKDVPQVLIWRKELGLVPLRAIDLMVAAAPPLLLTVTTRASLVTPAIVAGKVIEPG